VYGLFHKEGEVCVNKFTANKVRSGFAFLVCGTFDDEGRSEVAWDMELEIEFNQAAFKHGVATKSAASVPR
jgi:hypothetical protein